MRDHTFSKGHENLEQQVKARISRSLYVVAGSLLLMGQAGASQEKMSEAVELIESGQSQQALKTLKSFTPDESTRYRYFFLMGRANQDIKNNKEAMKNYSLSIRDNPNYAKAYINRGLTKGAQRDLQGALQDLLKAVELDNQSAAAYLNLGVTQAALNQPRNALESFNRALEINPSYADGYRNRGIVFNHLKKNSEACRDWKSSLKIKTDRSIQSWVTSLCS